MVLVVLVLVQGHHTLHVQPTLLIVLVQVQGHHTHIRLTLPACASRDRELSPMPCLEVELDAPYGLWYSNSGAFSMWEGTAGQNGVWVPSPANDSIGVLDGVTGTSSPSGSLKRSSSLSTKSGISSSSLSSTFGSPGNRLLLLRDCHLSFGQYLSLIHI